MRRVLLAASAGLALMVGLSITHASAAAEVMPGLETVSAFGQPASVTAVRVSLFDLYGFYPQGLEPTTSRTGLVQGVTLNITNPGGFVRKALLYWKFNKDTGQYEPKVSLTTYAYATRSYLTNSAKNPNVTLPIGLTDAQGDPTVNPNTNQPVGVVSPNVI